MDSSCSSVEIEDVELLKAVSRDDLFQLMSTDVMHFLQLIKKYKLENELSIFTSRSDDGGGLRIKFRIYPEDRWTEVGYFDDSDDSEVIDDFNSQVKYLLSRNRGNGGSGDARQHLEAQLKGNNDIKSVDYGK